MEHGLEHIHDELHSGVIIVVQQDLVLDRRLELLPGLGDNLLFRLFFRFDLTHVELSLRYFSR
jgi:hypothetical protein